MSTAISHVAFSHRLHLQLAEETRHAATSQMAVKVIQSARYMDRIARNQSLLQDTQSTGQSDHTLEKWYNTEI